MYRHAERPHEEVATGDVLVAIDVSGRAGARGRDGLRGADGAGAGADGQPGGHAGSAERGADAGRIEVSLLDEGGTIALSGARVTHDGRSESIRDRRTIGDHGFVDLTARGGRGGDGGHGGSGGDGARGHRGRDATRHSSGTHGGRGGDGGRGGRATSGADGGMGGAIVVRVRDEDTHLLLLVRQGVEGGGGGTRGAHGSGGGAGPGGAGGSSHSWTTTERYTDARGQSQTRTRFHHNAGGSSGPSGSSGVSGSGPLRDGSLGRVGSFAIEVETPAGTEQYGVRYHLALAGLEIHTPDADGVTEPGERVELRRVRVTNVGGMPTPRHRETRLEVVTTHWAQAIERAHLIVPRGLPAGATVELDGVLPLTLRDYATTAESDPLAEREPIVIDARVPDVARSFEGFLVPALEHARTLTVRFPVALSVLEGLGSLAKGEITRVRFAIRNQSRQPLGARSESQRRVRVRVHLYESELDDRHAVLFDEHGLPCLLGGEGLVRELERIEPGADAVFELAIGLRADAPAYRALRVRLTLEVGRLDAPNTLRIVQHRALEVRVAERVGDRSFDWLLVTNQATTREEVDAWRALAARQGRSIALYDLSLHGDLGLERPFEGGAPLIERAKGGLVIVLGYPMQTPSGPRVPTSFFTRELMHAMGLHRADLLVLGGEGDLRGWLAYDAAERDLASIAPHTDTDTLIEALSRARHEATEAERGLARAERVPVYEIVFGLETPKQERLVVRARAVAERLAQRFPEREHEVLHEFDPDPTSSWSPIRKRRLGWLRVLSRASARSGSAHLEMTAEQLHDPTTIASDTIASATQLARGVDDRVKALAECLATTEPDLGLATALSDALLVSIACEQLAVLRRTRARAGLDHASLVRALHALGTLADTRVLGPHAADSEVGAIVARLGARARFFARAQASLWERIPGLSSFRRAGAMIDATDDAIARFFAQQSGDPDAIAVLTDRMRVATELLESEWRAARANGQRDKAAFAKVMLLSSTWSSSFTVDEELLLAHEPSSTDAASWDAARAAERTSARSIGATEAALDEHRARFVLEGSTEAWLARAEEAESESTTRRRRASH